jgi:hypothetical protein
MSEIASLQRLPDELIAHILSSLDCVQSLPAIRLTCRKMHRAISGEAMWSILRRQIDEVLLPYAIAIHECVDIFNTWELGAREIGRGLVEMLQGGSSAVISRINTLTLEFRAAIEMGSLHDLVVRLANEFSGVCLSKLPGVPPGKVASKSEHLRVCRALYRTELFYLLCKKDDADPETAATNKHRRAFFDFYPPWVNEQMACIHDFLERKLFDGGYREIVAHDVFLGACRVDYLSPGELNIHTQSMVSGCLLCRLHGN